MPGHTRVSDRTFSVMLRRALVLFIGLLGAVSAPLALSGCNTVEGAGQDVEAAGEGLEDVAD